MRTARDMVKDTIEWNKTKDYSLLTTKCWSGPATPLKEHCYGDCHCTYERDGGWHVHMEVKRNGGASLSMDRR